MTLLTDFRDEVEAYLDRHTVSVTAFGLAAAGDPNFVPALRGGRQPRFGTIDRVRLFMTDHPDGLPKTAKAGAPAQGAAA